MLNRFLSPFQKKKQERKDRCEIEIACQIHLIGFAGRKKQGRTDVDLKKYN